MSWQKSPSRSGLITTSRRPLDVDEEPAARVHDHLRERRVETKALLLGPTRRPRRDSGDELVDEGRLPRSPCARSGRLAIRLGKRVQQLERVEVTDRLGHTRHRRWIAHIATRRRVGQQQVIASERHEHRTFVRRKAEPRRRSVSMQLGPDLGVIAGIPLAQIVQPRSEQQQIGASDTVSQRSGLDRGFDQMPIDREPVIRVVLWLAAAPSPLGQHTRQEVVLVERLECGDGRRACRQRIEQRRPSLGAPGSPRSCCLVAQPVESGRQRSAYRSPLQRPRLRKMSDPSVTSA